MIMIQPVNALTPKVFFKGGLESSRNSVSKDDKITSGAEEKIALMNAGGISVAIGAAMTAISRSYTSSWKSAGLIGAGAAVVAMTFLVPTFLYKAGINTRSKDADVFMKEKKLVGTTSKNSFTNKLETYSKNLLKRA